MPFTEDLCTGGVASASTNWTGHEPLKAFDDDPLSGSWQAMSGSGEHVAYEFGGGAARRVEKVRIKGTVWGGNLMIRNFRIEGTQDSSQGWVTLHAAEAENRAGWQEFAFSNAVAYRAVRVLVLDVWGSGGGNADIMEIEMMEAVPAPCVKRIRAPYGVKRPSAKRASPRYAVGYRAGIAKRVHAPYHIFGAAKKMCSASYHLMRSASKKTSAVYPVYRASVRAVLSPYHVSPPLVEIFGGGRPLERLALGLLRTGGMSGEFAIAVWNGKGAASGLLKMGDVRLTLSLADGGYAGGSGPDGGGAVSGRWMELKSSGAEGEGIEDDAQSAFAPVGGEPETGGLAAGDVPSGCARWIHCRVNLPADAAASFFSRPRLVVSYMAKPHPGFGAGHGEYFGG